MNPVPDRIERAMPGNGPVEDITLLDIQCNRSSSSGTSPAALVADVAAGDQIAFHWTDWPSSHVGPVITYMAAVPSGTDVTEYSPTGDDTIWFKIDEGGYKDGKWAATDVLTSQNSTWTITVPRALASGQYLVRHEIIALHQAESYPGTQFYPDCFQVSVTGSGTETPDSSALIAFPGGYTADTPGDITSYPIPGPSIWTNNGDFSGGSSGSSSTAAAATSSTATAPSSTVAAFSSVVSSSTASSSAATNSASSSSTAATSTSAAATSSSTVATTSSSSTASSATSGTITDADVCMYNYNSCIAASQPNPDWTGCTATKDDCLENATYSRRLRRSGNRGRRFF